MKKSFIVIILFAYANVICAQSGSMSKVWVADNGDGTYKNPVLHADYSDPDVIRVGNDYYLTSSSFTCTPGLPILHSIDMVNWKLINYALKKQVPVDVFNSVQNGKGVWAPSFNYRNGEFYIYYPDPDYGIYMIKTKNPAGDWSKPILVLPGRGIIDPTSFWDSDGKAYLAVGWAASRSGINSILSIYKMNSEGTAVIDEGKHVYDGHDVDRTVEGPKLYKKDGYYYIFAPAGGVSTGWQLALRAKNIYGPYERKVVMAQGNTTVNGPHQGALVQSQKGDYWFMHFQDKDAYGRVVHLQPVKWVKDWPVIGVDKDGDGIGEPVLQYKKPLETKIKITPVETDEFNTDTLGMQWQWQANPRIQWYALMCNTGFLRLFAYPSDSGKNLMNVPNLLLQKFSAPDFTVTTKLSWTVDVDAAEKKKGGLIVMGMDYRYLSISRSSKGYTLSLMHCENAMNNMPEHLIAQVPIADSMVYMRVVVKSPKATCTFSYSTDGEHFTVIGNPFTAKPGRWIGAKVGLFATSVPGTKHGGYLNADWFRLTPNE